MVEVFFDRVRISLNEGTEMAKARRVLPFSRPNWKIRAGPSGIHVFNRVTGLNVLVDEVGVSPSVWAGAPRQVSIAVTNACDLACSHCFAPKNPASLVIERLAPWLNELGACRVSQAGFSSSDCGSPWEGVERRVSTQLRVFITEPNRVLVSLEGTSA